MGWRAIQDNVDESESLAALSDFGERLYWRLVAKADAYGRLPGSIAKVRARCIPLLDKPDALIHDTLKELEHVGRIVWYQVDGTLFIEIAAFCRNQPRDAARSSVPSKFPAPGEMRQVAASRGSLPPRSRLEIEEKTIATAKPPQKPRERDELWDSLAAEIGSQPETKSERGRWNTAVKQLREAEATAEEVRARCRQYRKRWPDMTLTPTALAANWGSLAPPVRLAAQAPCPACGIGGGRHLAECPNQTPILDAGEARAARA